MIKPLEQIDKNVQYVLVIWRQRGVYGGTGVWFNLFFIYISFA